MTPDAVGPLSRPVDIDRLPRPGEAIVIEASPEERAALALDFGLPAIHSLVARFMLTGTRRRISVTGRVTASIRQVCVVSLEEFDSRLDEEVAVEFAEPEGPGDGKAGAEAADDGPDAIRDGRIDLGAVAAEFLALGLEPYPRKPGSEASLPDGGDGVSGAPSPFAALAALKLRS